MSTTNIPFEALKSRTPGARCKYWLQISLVRPNCAPFADSDPREQWQHVRNVHHHRGSTKAQIIPY
jgi:hypothetical protein